MPRGFTDREKENIRELLEQKGKELFTAYGIRKTNVEDLTRAAGISKGAFYIFYSSKEDLFFNIMEKYEKQFREMLMDELDNISDSPRETLKTLLNIGFSSWRSNPVMARFSQDDYAYLLRKLPEEKVKAHLNSDDDFVYRLIELLNAKGIKMRGDPSIISGLMKALFYVSLHEEEIGKDVFPQTMDLLLDLVSDHLVVD